MGVVGICDGLYNKRLQEKEPWVVQAPRIDWLECGEETMPPDTVEGHVILTLKYEREGNKWVGTCHELGTSTFARTLKRCQEELTELVGEHLNTLEQAGQRERFFRDWDIEFYSVRTTPSQIVLRGHGDPAWGKLVQGIMNPGEGPLLQPRAFPMGQSKGAQAVLNGV